MAFPSLVNNGQNRIKGGWTRQQKRCYRNILSWMSLKIGEGKQLLRVDLTSVKDGGWCLSEKLQMLRRMAEKEFGYEIEYFKVETSEGYGVLHMVWAITVRSKKAAWIPQKWLSDAWKDLTGASVVWIGRLGAQSVKKGGKFVRYRKRSVKEHIRSIARYFAGQYMAGQEAIVRTSYSYKRGKLSIVKSFRRFRDLLRVGVYHPGHGLKYLDIKRWEMFEGWNELLREGWWLADVDRCFYIQNGEIMMKVAKYA